MALAAPPAHDELCGLLSVLQLADSAFPSGRYTLSHGLETYAAQGALPARRPRAALGALLADLVRDTVARSDGVALVCAHRALSDDGELDLPLACAADRRLSAVKLVREAREASQRTGRALAASTDALGPGARVPAQYLTRVRRGETPGNHAVVLGLVCAGLGVTALSAVAGDLYAFCAGWATAAVRLGLVDHRGAQRLIHDARPVVAVAARAAAEGDVADIHACSPLTDVMAMRHEQAELRLFGT